MTDIVQNPRTLDEVCERGQMEQYRYLVKDVFDWVNNHGCRIMTRYERPESSCEWSATEAPIIRLNPKNNADPLDIIWTLLHEYGHFLSGKPATSRLNSQQKFERELLAWEYADKELINFRMLDEYKQLYFSYRAYCLKTYKDNVH